MARVQSATIDLAGQRRPVNYSELANQIGVDPSTVVRWFTRTKSQRRGPSLENARELAKVLKVSLEDVVGALGTGRNLYHQPRSKTIVQP